MSSGFCGQNASAQTWTLRHRARAQRGHAAPISLLKKKKKERQRAREELAFCQQERDGGASLKNLPTHHRRVFCMEPRPELFRTQGDPASGKGQPKACGESRQSTYYRLPQAASLAEMARATVSATAVRGTLLLPVPALLRPGPLDPSELPGKLQPSAASSTFFSAIPDICGGAFATGRPLARRLGRVCHDREGTAEHTALSEESH